MHNIKIFTDLSKYTRSDVQGKLKIKRGCNFKSTCCSIGECVICNDCLLSFTFGDRIIEDSEYSSSSLKEEVYDIDFFDEFNVDDFSNYMSSESSDYRCYDIKNGIIVRLSHSDLEKHFFLSRDDYIERFKEEENIKIKEENITGFQKIIGRLRGKK